MRYRGKLTSSLGIISVVATALIWAPPAAATEAVTPDDVVQIIDAAVPGWSENAAGVEQNSASNLAASASDNQAGASFPATSDGEIRLSGSNAPEEFSIGLPDGLGAGAANEAGNVVTYDSDAAFKAASALGEDGALTVMSILEGPSAPSRYEYDLSVPDGGQIILEESGEAVVVDADMVTTAFIEAPWAVDASGKQLPTHYVVEGNTLVQVVDHSSPDVAYPVVADPKVWLEWWGYAYLLSKAETKAVAGNSSATAAAVTVCSFIAGVNAIAATVCAGVVGWKVTSLFDVAKEASSQGRCLQINMPHAVIGGASALLINFTNVKCQQ